MQNDWIGGDAWFWPSKPKQQRNNSNWPQLARRSPPNGINLKVNRHLTAYLIMSFIYFHFWIHFCSISFAEWLPIWPQTTFHTLHIRSLACYFGYSIWCALDSSFFSMPTQTNKQTPTNFICRRPPCATTIAGHRWRKLLMEWKKRQHWNYFVFVQMIMMIIFSLI